MRFLRLGLLGDMTANRIRLMFDGHRVTIESLDKPQYSPRQPITLSGEVALKSPQLRHELFYPALTISQRLFCLSSAIADFSATFRRILGTCAKLFSHQRLLRLVAAVFVSEACF